MFAQVCFKLELNVNDNSTSVALPHVEIYTDGGCEPNPGPGGYGVVLLHPKTKKRAEASGGFRLTTNNRMEIYAAITGLEMLKQPCNVTLYSDSEYLVKSMMGGRVLDWKRKDWWLSNKERAKNIDLWERLLPLCEAHRVEFCWVKGHAGNLENEMCDRLSSAALRLSNLPADDAYEHKPETTGVRPALQEGGPCRKCSTPVIKQAPRKKSKQDHYYEYYLLCPKCQTTYTVEEAKRVIEQPPSML